MGTYYADNGAIHGVGFIMLVLLAMLFIAIWQQEFGQIAWIQWFGRRYDNPQHLFSRRRRIHARKSQELLFNLISAPSKPAEELGRKVFRRLYKKLPGDYRLDELLVSEEEWEILWAQPKRFARSLNEEAKSYGCSAMLTGKPPVRGDKNVTILWRCPRGRRG